MARSPEDCIDTMVLLDWPEDNPAPAFDRLAPDDAVDLLFIRELSVVASPEQVPEAVMQAVAAAAEYALDVRRGYVTPDADAVRFGNEVDALCCWLMGHCGIHQVPAWLGPKLADAIGDSSMVSAVEALVARDEPIIEVFVTLVSWGLFDQVLAGLSAADSGAIAQRLADDFAVTIATRESTGEGSPVRRTVLVREPHTIVASWPTATIHEDDLARSIVEAIVSFSVPMARTESAKAAAHVTSHAAPSRDFPEPPRHPETPVEAERELQALGPDAGVARLSGPGTDHSYADPVPAPHRCLPPEACEICDEPQGAVPSKATEPRSEIDRLSSGAAGALYLIAPIINTDLSDHGLEHVSPWSLIASVAQTILDVPVGDTSDPLWGQLRDWAEGDARRGDVPAHSAQKLAATIEAAFVRRPEEPPLATLLRVPGVIVDRPARIDVYFARDAARVAIRRNGFDFDPGWVPGLARVIRFHYGETP